MAASSADLDRARGLAARITRRFPPRSCEFDPTQVPAHLDAPISVVADAGEVAAGADLAELRRAPRCEARASSIGARPRAYPEPWRRFELPELPSSVPLELPQGAVAVFPTLARVGGAIEVRFEWSRRGSRRNPSPTAPCALARTMLDRQTRDLAKLAVGGHAHSCWRPLPYFRRDALIDLLLQLSFRRACFADREPPRTRAAFESAVDRGRAELHAMLDGDRRRAAGWFARGARGAPPAR